MMMMTIMILMMRYCIDDDDDDNTGDFYDDIDDDVCDNYAHNDGIRGMAGQNVPKLKGGSQKNSIFCVVDVVVICRIFKKTSYRGRSRIFLGRL